MRQFLLAAAALVASAGAAHAAELTRIGAPNAAISSAVVVPPGSTTVYVSGITPKPVTPEANGAPAAFGDIKAQTSSVLTQISDILKGQHMTMGDVVMMRVYMAADSTGKIDTAAMNEVFRTFFGSKDQPNKPSRVTFQVARLVNPALLIEIEAQAAKAP
jgi:enamine deaminase RidA (YjgF/YER057c/UK114 family)